MMLPEEPSTIAVAALGIIFGLIARAVFKHLLQPHVERIIAAALGARSTSRSRLDGIWESSYEYPDSRPGQPPNARLHSRQHYLVAQQYLNKLILKSLPNQEGSDIRLDLTIDGGAVNGFWREKTSKDADYHGVIQLILRHDRKRMSGLWLGYDKRGQVNHGEWDLELVSTKTSKEAREKYTNVT